jgi:hypothetical protein
VNTTPFTLFQRLMRLTRIDRKTGCYLYMGPNNGGYRGGLYGKISMRLPGRPNPTGVATHRVSYETFKRKVRTDREVAHKCHNSLCWFPGHLVEQTHVQNCRERDARRA